MFLHVHTSIQVVKKEYFSHGQPQFSFNFSFREDFVFLKIPEKGELGGWKISPFYDPKVSSLLYSRYLLHLSTACTNKWQRIILFFLPQITRQQINCFRSGKGIPKCELLLQWSEKIPPAPLECKIGLIGARDHTYFLLHINPGKYTSMDTNS